MNYSQFYIILALSVLGVIALIVMLWKMFVVEKKPPIEASPLASLALILVVAGIVFGNNQLLGYGLIGGGVLLALIDIIVKLNKK